MHHNDNLVFLVCYIDVQTIAIIFICNKSLHNTKTTSTILESVFGQCSVKLEETVGEMHVINIAAVHTQSYIVLVSMTITTVKCKMKKMS